MFGSEVETGEGSILKIEEDNLLQKTHPILVSLTHDTWALPGTKCAHN